MSMTAMAMRSLPDLRSDLTPDRTRRINNQLQFPALVLFAQRIAGNRAGEAALRAERQPLKVDIARGLLDPLLQCVNALEHRRLGADETKHDAAVLRHEA